VTSAQVIDGLARETRCAVCEASVILEEHDAIPQNDLILRRVRVVCKECHTPRVIWFRVDRPRPN
jgi:hypothetical protein